MVRTGWQRRLVLVALFVAALWVHAGSTCTGTHPGGSLVHSEMAGRAAGLVTVSSAVVEPGVDSHAGCVSMETSETALLVVPALAVFAFVGDRRDTAAALEALDPIARTPVAEHVVDRS